MPYSSLRDFIHHLESNGRLVRVSAPVSTVLNSFCLHLLVTPTVEKLIAVGVEPPLWLWLSAMLLGYH